MDRLVNAVCAVAPPSLAQFVMRLALAVPFWRSGINKWESFPQLNESTLLLFRSEFMLHFPGGPYPFPAPDAMAFLSGCCELLFPILLVVGLGTRLVAIGLLLMTLIVQFTVPDGWPIHIGWAALALGIMVWGPGRVSLDFGIRRLVGQPTTKRQR